MHAWLRTFCAHLLESVIPARPTERVIKKTTLSELRLLVLRGEYAGALPYHDKRVRALVWEVKYHKHPRAVALAGILLGEEILARASEELGLPLLVPIPMHKARRHMRGHNQTEVLCEAALLRAPECVEYAPHALVRVCKALPQQELSRQERLHNVEGSMEADSKIARGRTCIVLDDVATTGATLAEAKRALRKAGARSVVAITLARS